MPPCTHFIAREDPHSKCILCLGFSHAREAVYGTSNCKTCDDFRLKTLRSRLEDYERESSKFSRRASSTNAPPREIAASREAAASHRAASWGSDVELEEMESEQTGLASHLSPSLAPSWKSRPLLPSKPCRTTSALIGKSYIAAGQAGMALHTMAILQAYQADVLKEMDEGTGLTPEAVKELRRATDLALRATKHTARAVGRSMAASVAAERHLWLNLTKIREKEKTFLMDAPISQSGLFGEAVSAVVHKFRSAKTQSAALNQFMPRRARDFSTPSSSVSRDLCV